MLAKFSAPFSAEKEKAEEIVPRSLEGAFDFITCPLHRQPAVRRLSRVTVEDIQVRAAMAAAHEMQNFTFAFNVKARMAVPAPIELAVRRSVRVDVQDVLIGEVDRLPDFDRNIKELFEYGVVAPALQIEEEYAGIEVGIVVGEPKIAPMRQTHIAVGDGCEKDVVDGRFPELAQTAERDDVDVHIDNLVEGIREEFRQKEPIVYNDGKRFNVVAERVEIILQIGLIPNEFEVAIELHLFDFRAVFFGQSAVDNVESQRVVGLGVGEYGRDRRREKRAVVRVGNEKNLNCGALVVGHRVLLFTSSARSPAEKPGRLTLTKMKN